MVRPVRSAMCGLLLILMVFGCDPGGIREQGSPVGWVWNRTDSAVVVTYLGPNGAKAPWEMNLKPGEKALAFQPYESFAVAGCLPGKLVATIDGRTVAEATGWCADVTWEIMTVQGPVRP